VVRPRVSAHDNVFDATAVGTWGAVCVLVTTDRYQYHKIDLLVHSLHNAYFFFVAWLSLMKHRANRARDPTHTAIRVYVIQKATGTRNDLE
jgi:hypothetical protein